ncbi:hypothetical protein PR202_ga16421 [Eleusine coracana subsp. coracana]|uniref:Mediator of RNA polymerase II transcription subunit 10 n=1 Tax=Eleusine coracana subsp. coracana TaxID=191504 RepID=A0AAV5CMS4_ELECO|nr:hypothetical protein PR202_ga16421 [Eleusine coracana subsp. coracana]
MTSSQNATGLLRMSRVIDLSCPEIGMENRPLNDDINNENTVVLDLATGKRSKGRRENTEGVHVDRHNWFEPAEAWSVTYTLQGNAAARCVEASAYQISWAAGPFHSKSLDTRMIRPRWFLRGLLPNGDFVAYTPLSAPVYSSLPVLPPPMDNVAPNPSAMAAAAAAAGNGVQASGAGGDRPEDPSKQNLAQVTNSIQRTLGLLHQLNLTVSSFNSASQLPLLQRLNGLVAELDTMQKLAEGCNIQVPMEVVNLIDDGKNPDEFTRDVLNSCIAKNQITKGKTDAFKSLRKHLLEELEEAFPEDVEGYREIRATAAAVSGTTFDLCHSMHSSNEY